MLGVEKQLRRLLRERGRGDLERDALERVTYTDDGSSLYVHVIPKPSWPHRRPGQAYVLALSDKKDLKNLADHRALLRDARLQLTDEIDDLVRWFEGA